LSSVSLEKSAGSGKSLMAVTEGTMDNSTSGEKRRERVGEDGAVGIFSISDGVRRGNE